MKTLNRRRTLIGLGNPGSRYRCTRHNLGFMVVDTIAELHKVRFHRECKCYLGTFAADETEIVLAKPATYMNNSGRAANAIMETYSPDCQELIVICDDLNLVTGNIRIRRKGSCGGHKGLESIAIALGHSNFPRLRIGIGEPGRRDPVDYVLDEFRRSEMPVIEDAKQTAIEALETWISEGINTAMNRFN